MVLDLRKKNISKTAKKGRLEKRLSGEKRPHLKSSSEN